MKKQTVRTNAFTLLELMVAVGLFSMMALVLMDAFDGTKKNINEISDREEVFTNGVRVLTEIQESIHQAAEIYNHVPSSTSNDTETNLFFKSIDWSALPLRMGSSIDYDNRLPDFTGQTKAITDWKTANPTDDYAKMFHNNDIILSLPPASGPGIPATSRGYAGNMLLIAKHLPPIEVVLSPTDTTFDAAKLNPLSHLYGQYSQRGNQILYCTSGEAIKGEERMYSVDVIRFELYYLTEQPADGAKKVYSTDNSVYRDKCLRLVKAESMTYVVYDKLSTLKKNLDKAYHSGDPIPPSVTPNPLPNDFPIVFKALTTKGVYFENQNKRRTPIIVSKTIEYTDTSAGCVIRTLSSAGANGFSTNPTGEKISFGALDYKVLLANSYISSSADLSVGYNTKWTTGKAIQQDPAKHIPWFAQQPELCTASPKSEFFPSGFEISGSGLGVNQRIGIRICLWLRTPTYMSAYSHYGIGARAQ